MRVECEHNTVNSNFKSDRNCFAVFKLLEVFRSCTRHFVHAFFFIKCYCVWLAQGLDGVGVRLEAEFQTKIRFIVLILFTLNVDVLLHSYLKKKN